MDRLFHLRCGAWRRNRVVTRQDYWVVPVVPPGVAGAVLPDGAAPGVAGVVGVGLGVVGMLEGGVGGVAGTSSFLPHATSAREASKEAASRDFFISVSLRSQKTAWLQCLVATWRLRFSVSKP